LGCNLRWTMISKMCDIDTTKWEKKMIKEFNVERKAPSPALIDLMADDEES
jgi:hypothetical protein